MPSTARAAIARLAQSRTACAAAGFALGAAFFGMDDLERLGMWAQDQATAIAAPPALIADEDSAPARSALKTSIFAKLRAGGFATEARPKGIADDILAEGTAQPKRWTIPYWIDPSGLPPEMPKERAIALVAKAAGSWGACGARFSYQGERAKPAYGAYGPGEDPADYRPIIGWMSLPDDVSGLTLTESDPRTGQVERWTMDLAPDRSKAASELLATATHEFGHVLGMEHGRDVRSIMFGGSNPKVMHPTVDDLAECGRVVSSWSPESAADMALPLAADSQSAPQSDAHGDAVAAATLPGSLPSPSNPRSTRNPRSARPTNI